jgi:hypothetical protein
MSRRHFPWSLVLVLALVGCSADSAAQSDAADLSDEKRGPGEVAELPDQPGAGASSEFWNHWGDGKAELASYRGKINRYGELRDATSVLVYVTEPHDRRTWVKDDGVEGKNRVEVIKLNRVLKFQTGIYPYSVMTSIFSPVADWGGPRFQPTKVTLTAQEWCGHVFHGMWPGSEQFLYESRSYFAKQGDSRQTIETAEDTLYQDALPIQLRELDGKFNDGETWSGMLVPSLWRGRKGHAEPTPVEATIEREETTLDETPVTRFTLTYDDVEVVYDIEREYPHRLVRWRHSDGSHLRLQESTRLPYWKLNKPGDESYREELDLEPDVR